MQRMPVALALALLVAACSDDESTATADAAPDAEAADAGAEHDTNDDDSSPAGDAGQDASDDAGLSEPAVPDLPEGWTIIEPGGDTICSRGTPYRYAVRRGTVNKVVVDFMGGGACWDGLTCSIADAIFNDSTEGLVDLFDDPDPEGIYDTDNPENPFADWWHVFIPYCTGDIHWGDATTSYGEGDDALTIEHRGAVNARTALDWAEASFEAPDDVFITGCSAGAYGSILWAPEIIERFPDAQVAHLGDSGAGVITEQFFRDSFPSWNAEAAFPSFIPTLDPATNEILGLSASDLYGRIAAYYPDIVFSQYHTAFDDNQAFYFEAMGGGDQRAWSEQMYSQMEYAESLADNVTTYIAPGERHCIIIFDAFYETESNGVRLVDWVNELVAGEQPDSVRCVDCDAPE